MKGGAKADGASAHSCKNSAWRDGFDHAPALFCKWIVAERPNESIGRVDVLFHAAEMAPHNRLTVDTEHLRHAVTLLGSRRVALMHDRFDDSFFHARGLNQIIYHPMLITSLDHPLANQKRIRLEDIAKHALILPPRDQSTFRFVELVFAEHSLQHEVKLEVGGYDVIKTYVKLGLGISVAMSHCLSDRDELFATSMRRWFPSRKYGIVHRKGRTLTAATQRFVETICKSVKADLPHAENEL